MILFVLSLLLQLAATTASTPGRLHPQFCTKNDIWALDACVAISKIAANNGDVHFAFSAAFKSGKGWLAFGPGTRMSNGLMFVFYPSANADGLSNLNHTFTT